MDEVKTREIVGSVRFRSTVDVWPNAGRGGQRKGDMADKSSHVEKR